MARLLMLPVLLGLLALAVAGCGDDDTESGTPADGNGDTQSGGELVVAQVDRAEADPALARATGEALADFGVDLYGQLPAEGNLVFSPYSAYVALGMARAGAAGQTRDEMSAVLHANAAGPNPGDLDGGLNAISQALAERPGEFESFEGTVTLELSTANQIWAQQGREPVDAFLQTLGREYGAGVRLVDFAADTEGARQAINGWVSEQTRERIPMLIPMGVLTPSTPLVLTNAVYLNAPWAIPFNAGATSDAPFTRLDGSTVDAPLMQQETTYRYLNGEDFEAIELDYIGHELSMVVVVPDAGSFRDVEAALDAETLVALPERMTRSDVLLRFPKFEFRVPSTLNGPLAELGMPTAFSGEADFSGIWGEPGYFISAVIHEAFIAVDELGTEAAAATAVAFDESAPERVVELTVDRPFLFFIRDVETGAVLFLGRVLDPKQ